MNGREGEGELAERVEFLATCEILAGVPRSILGEVASAMRVLRLPADTKLFGEGETGSSAFLVVEGEVELSHSGVRLLSRSRGDCIGEFALIDDTPRSATVRATTDIELLEWDREAFVGALSRSGQVAQTIMRALAGKLREGVGLQLQVEEANRLKSEFLARMSHDMRTYLNAIAGYTQLLLDETKPALEERHYSNLQQILTNTDGLLHLMNDIVDLSRVESGRVVLHCEDVDVNALTGQCVEVIEPLAQAGVEVRREFDAKQLIHTDADRLQRALLNLLSNAAKFTQAGSITVSVHDRDGEVEIAVRDTGPGIPPEELPFVFDEFHRVRDNGQATEGGGLGLAIARKSVELIGGSIAVESEDGQGTRFTVRVGSCEEGSVDSVEANRAGT